MHHILNFLLLLLFYLVVHAFLLVIYYHFVIILHGFYVFHSYNYRDLVVELIYFTMHTMNVLLQQTFPFANAHGARVDAAGADDARDLRVHEARVLVVKHAKGEMQDKRANFNLPKLMGPVRMQMTPLMCEIFAFTKTDRLAVRQAKRRCA